MSALYFTNRNGEIVTAAKVRSRVLAYCRTTIKGQPEWRENLKRLLDAYGERSPWWRQRNGCLVESICRDALHYAIWEEGAI